MQTANRPPLTQEQFEDQFRFAGFAMPPPRPSPLQQALQDLENVGALPDGWHDGDGAAVNREVLEFAETFIPLLDANLLAEFPDITPSYPESGLDLFWPGKAYMIIGQKSGIFMQILGTKSDGIPDAPLEISWEQVTIGTIDAILLKLVERIGARIAQAS